MVFQRLPIEGEAFVLFTCTLHLFVEAAFSFVAEPFSLQHLLVKIRQLEVAPLIKRGGRIARYRTGHVRDYVSQNIQAHQIDGAEGGRSRPSHSLPGQRVHIFNAQIHLLHQPHDVQHRKRSDAIADEVRRVFGENNALAEMNVAEVGNRVDGRAVGVGRRNEFQQPHVPRRIKEVCPKPRTAKIVGESFGNFPHGQPAGVGRNNGPGLADSFYLPQQSPLEIEVLDYRLDDPVHVGQPFEVIVEVADGDQPRQRRHP